MPCFLPGAHRVDVDNRVVAIMPHLKPLHDDGNVQARGPKVVPPTAPRERLLLYRTTTATRVGRVRLPRSEACERTSNVVRIMPHLKLGERPQEVVAEH